MINELVWNNLLLEAIACKRRRKKKEEKKRTYKAMAYNLIVESDQIKMNNKTHRIRQNTKVKKKKKKS